MALIAAALLVGSGAGGGMTPARASGPVTRYASPSGTASSSCPHSAPCDIVTAVNDAVAGDRVEIEPGTYGSAGAPITTELTDVGGHGALDVYGEPGAPVPVIYSSASSGIFFFDGSDLSRIDLHSSGGENGVADIGGVVDHVIVRSTGALYGACGVFGTLRDSLCTTSGTDDPALEFQDSGTDQSAIVRGVTAEATGSGGIGLADEIDSANTVNVTVTNSIIHGAGDDIATIAASGGTASVNLVHSDYRATATSKTGLGTGVITGGATDIAAAPKFIHPAAGNYQEKAGSPTINAGATDPAAGTDLAGNPRTLGPAPDIGAYEFLQKPTTHALTITRKNAHTAHLTVRVNPEGLSTTVKLVATGGGKHVTSPTVSAGSGRTTSTVHLTLHGLSGHTGYKIHAVATNKAGHTHSAKKSLTTKR